jgi:hypothetical protein
MVVLKQFKIRRCPEFAAQIFILATIPPHQKIQAKPGSINNRPEN